MTASAPQTNSMITEPTGIPNVYHLTGKGVRVTYFPTGEGPLTTEGPIKMVYQDQHQARTFRAHEVTATDVADLGSVVTVAWWEVPDLGVTTVSLVVPEVVLGAAKSVPVHTLLIATLHSSTLFGLAHPQRDTYSVTELSGTASTQILAA